MIPEPEATFYPRWIVANAWAEAAGLGTTLLLGRAAARVLEQDAGTGAVLAGAMAAVTLGVLLEGALVGGAQARVLRGSLQDLSAADWIKATMLGAGVAWLLGMVPSTVAALVASSPSSRTVPPPEPSALGQYGLALLLGAVTGPLLGLGQWLVLRRHVARAGRWIVANAVAWALGMVVIFLGMDQLPWQRGGLVVVAGVYLVCGAAGALVGVVHGRVLRALLREARSVPRVARGRYP
jgi:hypothetical protein